MAGNKTYFVLNVQSDPQFSCFDFPPVLQVIALNLSGWACPKRERAYLILNRTIFFIIGAFRKHHLVVAI